MRDNEITKQRENMKEILEVESLVPSQAEKTGRRQR